MNRNIILIMALLLLNPSVHAQSIGGDAYNSNGPKPSSQPRIVTPHCDEPISKVMGEMIKYYIDRGDFESAGALNQVAKKYQMAVVVQPNKIPRPKEENVPWTYDQFKHWIFGYF